MNITAYQLASRATAVYPNINSNMVYPTLGLMGEFGELAEKLKKGIRDDEGRITESKRIDIIKEAGDVFWYIAAIASEAKIELEEQDFAHLEFKVDRCDIFHMLFHMHISVNEIVKLSLEKMEAGFKSLMKHNLHGLIEELRRFLLRLDIRMSDVLEGNITKLLDRKNRNVLGGSGDNR